MKQRKRTGFEYIDLGGPFITEGFRPHPGSNPKELYVARLRRDKEGNIFVEDVYRLMTKRVPRYYGRKEFVVRRSDNKNLAVRVTRGDLIDTFRRLYEDISEQNITE